MNLHRQSRLLGYALEQQLAIALTYAYPGESFKVLYKQIYDISNRCVLLDNVSIDKQGRLLVNHKNKCIRHRRQAHQLGKRGYISFLYNDIYWFLPVNSEYVTKCNRPKINKMLLRSCVTDVMCPSNVNKTITTYENIKRLNWASSLEQQQNYSKHTITKPPKPAYLIQEERQRMIIDHARLMAHKHDIV